MTPSQYKDLLEMYARSGPPDFCPDCGKCRNMNYIPYCDCRVYSLNDPVPVDYSQPVRLKG